MLIRYTLLQIKYVHAIEGIKYHPGGQTFCLAYVLADLFISQAKKDR